MSGFSTSNSLQCQRTCGTDVLTGFFIRTPKVLLSGVAYVGRTTAMVAPQASSMTTLRSPLALPTNYTDPPDKQHHDNC